VENNAGVARRRASVVRAALVIKPQARTLATDRGIGCVVMDYDELRLL